jgi:hypothetical protein
MACSAASGSGVSLAAGYQTIQCPQRVILGTHGFSELRADRGYLADDRQEMFTISGGHHCHLEQPSQVAELIFGLVNKI